MKVTHYGEDYAKIKVNGKEFEVALGLAEAIEAEQKRGQFLAVVPTSYEIFAVADTEAKAKKLALKAAHEWIEMSGVHTDVKTILAELGCNVYPLSSFGVGQEG